MVYTRVTSNRIKFNNIKKKTLPTTTPPKIPPKILVIVMRILSQKITEKMPIKQHPNIRIVLNLIP